MYVCQTLLTVFPVELVCDMIWVSPVRSVAMLKALTKLEV